MRDRILRAFLVIGDVLYTSLEPPLAKLADAAGLESLPSGTRQIVDHPTAPRASDGVIYKCLTIANGDAALLAQIGLPIPDSSPVSLRFNGAL